MPNATAEIKLIQDITTSFYGFINSNLFLIKAIFILISLVFLILIVYLNLKLNITGEKIQHWVDVIGSEKITKKRSFKAWAQIKRRLETGDQNHLKLAILEADRVLGEITKLGGYPGRSMNERLEKMTSTDLPGIEKIRQIHQLRSKIVSDPGFQISKEEAEEVIKTYGQAFREFGLIEAEDI